MQPVDARCFWNCTQNIHHHHHYARPLVLLHPTAASRQATASDTAPASKSEIKQAQEQLKAAGMYKGKVDGNMGPETKQAISQFQQQKGLDQTGKLDQQTLSAMSNNNAGANSGASGYGSSTTPSTQSLGAGGLNNNSNSAAPNSTGSGSNGKVGTGETSLGGSNAGNSGAADSTGQRRP